MTGDDSWKSPPTDLMLSSNDVHVWCASLDVPASRVGALRSTLTTDELHRSKRFRFQRDCEHFIVARGLARAILSRYLKVKPAQLRFYCSSHGKPLVATRPAREPLTLSFSLSHSDALVLCALARGRRIGVDVERVRTDFAWDRIAQRYFSPGERIALQSLPSDTKHEAFFTGWTRKEAYVKARGEGLSLPLDQFAVSLKPTEPAALLSTRWDPQEASLWSLHGLTPAPGYAAAVAVEGHDWRLERFQWSG